ncbi:MAG TPA: hypothetical protein VFK33_04915 [Bacillales bacterium]|nr:hypothetical protein [Bacillales bacterium]
MRKNRFLKAGMFGLAGCATAGGWLIVDLLLPDPVGDYLLYILMAMVNGAIGWQVARSSAKLRKRAANNTQPGYLLGDSQISDTRNAIE